MPDNRPSIDTERSVGDYWTEKAEKGRAFLNSPPPGEPTPALRPRDESAMLRELRRVVAADAPERRLPLHATMVPVFLRFDPTHDLPHIVETEKGHIIARFEKDADLAWFIRRKNDDRTTLPEAYVFQLTGGQL